MAAASHGPYSLTPRLLLVGAGGLLALLILVFMLGLELGRLSAAPVLASPIPLLPAPPLAQLSQATRPPATPGLEAPQRRDDAR